MPWARLDDMLWSNSKIIAMMANEKVALDALGLHTLALSYCAGQLTDGVVDISALRRFAPMDKRRVLRLTNCLFAYQLWDRIDDEKWQIHDYLEYNPSRAEVQARRTNDKHRQRRHRSHLYAVTP